MFELIRKDLARLDPDGNAPARTLVAGLLSQGFQAILVYRFFHWLQQKGWSGQPLRFFCERFIEQSYMAQHKREFISCLIQTRIQRVRVKTLLNCLFVRKMICRRPHQSPTCEVSLR